MRLLDSSPLQQLLYNTHWLAFIGPLLLLLIYVGINEVKRRGALARHRAKPEFKPGGTREMLVDQKVVIEPLNEFDWKTATRRAVRPFKPIYYITMGLQSAPPSELITIDEDYLNRITLRRQLMAQHGSRVHGSLPCGVDSVKELYSYLSTEYLPTRYPTVFALSGDGEQLHNSITGKDFPAAPGDDAATNLRVLGETVEEDMFLLHQTPDGHLCVAFVCCFPSGFDPSTKFGNLLKDIHRPVPSYEKIGPSMERFFAKVKVGGNVRRTNWSIQTHNELFDCAGNHSHDAKAVATPDEYIDPDNAFLRIEWQTLSRLPKTQALLFSFKTYVYPLRQIKEEGSGPELADAIDGLKAGNAPGMVVYKRSAQWGPAACAYLRS